MFKVQVTYESGTRDLRDCTADEAEAAVSDALVGGRGIVDVVAWEV
jgi:hypothetical protein